MKKDYLKKAAELEAEAKRFRRMEKAFWDDVEDRKDEVIKHLNLSDKFDDICATYGATSEADREALYSHIVSERQINYYKNNSYYKSSQSYL